MMALGEKFAIVCMDAILEGEEKDSFRSSLLKHGKEIVEISINQVNHFARNALELIDENGKHKLAMSSQAFASLRKDQVDALEKYAEIVHAPIDTIERVGGGSVRCMIAELF